MNVRSNFISHEITASNNKGPPWFNKAIKCIIQEKKTHSKTTVKAIIAFSYYKA